MGWLRRIALALLGRYGARLRYPHLFLLAAAAFVFDLVLPDGLPFLDELVFGLLTLLFATWRARRGEGGADPEVARSADARAAQRTSR
ncbi:MAG: DUF6116 family protein [Myxococcota bacterium]